MLASTLVLACLGSLAVDAQSLLDRAKSQYEAAAYEEALSTLSRAGEVSLGERVQVEQYRALCLIALGKQADAEESIGALVAADPTYVPSPSIASPKVLQMVAEIRRRELPAVIRRLVDEGRLAFQGKDLARARQNFELVLKLTDDPALGERPETEDLKVVARGFVTLTMATEAPAPAPAPPAATPAAPASTAEQDGDGGEATPTTSAPRLPAFEAAVPIQQAMPAWEPPGRAFAQTEYNGSLKVTIGIDGKVKNAVIERASHPAYDARLLQVAQSWTYKPATRNGTPVESEKVIAVQLRPLH
jgi:tetratricopeptide (TPR) repeat protein